MGLYLMFFIRIKLLFESSPGSLFLRGARAPSPQSRQTILSLSPLSSTPPHKLPFLQPLPSPPPLLPLFALTPTLHTCLVSIARTPSFCPLHRITPCLLVPPSIPFLSSHLPSSNTPSFFKTALRHLLIFSSLPSSCPHFHSTLPLANSPTFRLILLYISHQSLPPPHLLHYHLLPLPSRTLFFPFLPALFSLHRSPILHLSYPSLIPSLYNSLFFLFLCAPI